MTLYQHYIAKRDRNEYTYLLCMAKYKATKNKVYYNMAMRRFWAAYDANLFAQYLKRNYIC